MRTINENHKMYSSWDMKRDGQNFLSFWTVFCIFTPLTCPRNKNFKKMKKTTGDIIILHKCNKNHDHMQYCSWDMACDGCNCYFSFWAIFCHFTLPPPPLNSPKNQNFKKWKKYLQISSFTHVYQKL